MLRAAIRGFRRPLTDYFRLLDDLRGDDFIVLIAAAVVTWFVYVPVHELLHVAGCLLGGGMVETLELAPLYGGRLLQPLFPFIEPHSDYAGRLSGFDTGGSDGVYLLTVLLPFALTLLPGVPLLQWHGPQRRWRALAAGCGLPLAFAPFISLPGDYYEAGSILVTRVVAAFFSPAADPGRWRSDDLPALLGRLYATGGDGTLLDGIIVGAALLLAVLLAWLTYGLGSGLGRILTGPHDPPRPRSQ
ncbi:MAG: hypothetical protein R3202_06985 [Candidatus Competibacterales bacterium]|nr:hypothetical protein [Candidatus Competibacterales bacterium]